MIGEQKTGAVPGVVISAVAHEGLRVTVDGRPGRLAVVDDQGRIVAAGADVEREARAVAVNSYRQMWMGQGHLRVLSKPIAPGESASGDSGRPLHRQQPKE